MTSIGQSAGRDITNRKARFTIEPGGVLVLLQAAFFKKSRHCNVEVRHTGSGR